MSKITATILVVLATVFWGINFHAGKYVVAYISPIEGSAIRFGLASVVMLIMLFSKERLGTIWDALKKHWQAYSMIGLIGIAGFNVLFFWGLKNTTAINGSLIMATNPLISILLAALILQESIRINQYFGMFLSLLGVVLVVTQGNWDMIRHFQIASGDWMIMGANLCFALYSVLCKRYLRESKPLITTAMTMISGTLALLLVSSPLSQNFSWFFHHWLLLSLFHMAFLGTVLAYLFWNTGLLYLGISQTVIFFNLTPVFTVLMALMLGEPILIMQILGGALVLAGVIVSTNFVSR